LCCGIEQKKNCSVVGYNGKNFSFVGYNRRKFVTEHPEIVLLCIPHRRKTSSLVSHTGKNSLLLYPTAEENLFRKKNLNNCTERNFSAKSILLMNQGPKWSSLMKKIEGKKSRGTIPLNNFCS
jgi:hypothetical protein